MPASMTPPALLSGLRRRGFTVRVIDGSISVIPASRLSSADRQAIRECRDNLLAILTPGAPWDTATALRLMNAADALVERLGVDGRHPKVAAAAAVVTSAHATRDMETLRFAVAEFTAVVRRIAAQNRPTGVARRPA